jgi:hypothetical protein
MGCDIHFRVEYYGPIETVVQNDNGEITVAPEGEYAWQPAEAISENEWIIRWKQNLADGRITQEQYDALIAKEPPFRLNYNDRFYTGRNYALFGFLSDVRTAWDNPICGPDHPNFGTLPGDVSPEIEDELSVDDVDLHSHGWLTLTELLAANWEELTEAGKQHNYDPAADFKDTLTLMEAVALEKCDGNTDHVRAIWAYDN